jgi:hypothetical protein
MFIIPDNDGWSISPEPEATTFHLVFDDGQQVIDYFKADGITSTQLCLFVGTEAECQAYAADQQLTFPQNPE